ncbi:MAG: M23 family metallopeptidase [Myxococcales bacterium]|nr:M23 family metallopeptidase [Myxococcales bacterium]
MRRRDSIGFLQCSIRFAGALAASVALVRCAPIDEPSMRQDASRTGRDGAVPDATMQDTAIDSPQSPLDVVDPPDVESIDSRAPIDVRVTDTGVATPDVPTIPTIPGCTPFQDRTTSLVFQPSPPVAPNRAIAHVRGPDGWTNIGTRMTSTSGRVLDGMWGGVVMEPGGFHWQYIFDPTYTGTYCVEVRSDPSSTLRWRGVVRIDGRDPGPVMDSGVPTPCANGCYVTAANRATNMPTSSCAADGEYRAGTETDATPTCWRCRAATRAGTTMAAGWVGGGRFAVCNASVETAPVDGPGDFFLPWTGGVGRRVEQGPNGGFSHGGIQAWDFGGGGADTAVRATAAGTVRYARFNSNRGCGDRSCIDDANYVVIDHTINGMAVQSLYYHLAYAATPPVAATDRVARGQIIGYIGSTGWSTAAHIHFHFQRSCGGVWCNSGTVDYLTLNASGFRDVGRIAVGNSYSSGNSR